MNELTIKVDQDIKLISWKKEFAPNLFNLTLKNKPYLIPWLSWAPHINQVSDSEKFINTAVEGLEKGQSLELGIWFKNQLVGCVGFHNIDVKDQRAAIGYWLDIDYWSKGIITKSVKSLIDYGFSELKIIRIELLAATNNPNSFHVAERLNFKKEGILRKYEYVNDEFQDCLIYSLLKSDL